MINALPGLLIFASFLSVSYFIEVGGVKLTFLDFTIIGSSLLLITIKDRISFYKSLGNFLALFLIIIITFFFISSARFINDDGGITLLITYLRMIFGLLIFIYIFLSLDPKSVHNAMLSLGIAITIMGLISYVYQFSQFDGNYDNFFRPRYGGISDRGYFRLIGFVGDPNFHALITGVLIILLLKTRTLNKLNSLYFFILLISHLLSFSRSGIVSLLLVGLLFSNLKIKILAVSIFFLLLNFININDPTVLGRFSLEVIMNDNRQELFRDVINQWVGNEAFGIGLRSIEAINQGLLMHNSYLDLLFGHGYFIFLIFITYLIIIIAYLYSIKERFFLAILLFISLQSLFISISTFYPYYAFIIMCLLTNSKSTSFGNFLKHQQK